MSTKQEVEEDKKEKKNTPLPPLPVDLSKIPDLQTSWDEWVEHRRGIKKPLTVLAAEKTFKFLRGQADPVALIDTAIRNGWRGLFKEKENGQGQNRQSPPVNSQLARAQYQHGEKDVERYRKSAENLRAIREDFENGGGASKK